MRTTVLILSSFIVFGFVSLKYGSFSATDKSNDILHSRRQLQSSWVERHPDRAISDWARNNFQPLSTSPGGGEKEVYLFWHLPKSGGSTAKNIYKCLGLSLASRLKPSIGKYEENDIIAFEPFGRHSGTYVNVDVTTHEGMLRAEELGLVPSGKADIIFAMEVSFAGDHLFDAQHKGRMLGLFRHPIQRLVSKFYYLQTATWEKTYRPEWKGMDIYTWATTQNKENNIMVKQLSGLKFRDTATEVDLRRAMRTIEKRFVVGLTDEMKESIRRFNIIMNIDLTPLRNQNCMRRYFGHVKGSLKTNSHPHPNLEPGSPAWDALAEANSLDIQLYDHIIRVFYDQKAVIDSYSTSVNELNNLEVNWGV